MNTKMYRIVSGRGGDCVLIMGSEKTAIVDCGMAYAAPKLVEELTEKLEGRPLDYLLATHTHYDHIGAMGYLRQAWPALQVVGNAHGHRVLQRVNALTSIRQLSQVAASVYGGIGFVMKPYDDRDLHIDYVITDGTRISLGDNTILILETPGHTNCSLSYFLEEDRILFVGESIGCYYGKQRVASSVLTGFEDAFTSIQRCRSLRANTIVSPHYGIVEDISSDRFLDLAKEAAEEVYDFVAGLLLQGLPHDKILDAMQQKYWMGWVTREQPQQAFLVNATATVKTVERSLKENS